MKNRFSIIIISIVAAGAVSAQDNDIRQYSLSSSNYLDLPGCNVQLIEDIDLPALESGQINKMNVKPGDSVSVGTVVARMDDQRAQRALEESTLRHQIADNRANDSTEINTAYKRYQLAYIEHTKSAKLKRSGSVSGHNANRAKYSAEVAQLEYEGAKKARDLAAIEAAAEMVRVRAAEDSIKRHKIKAPITGTVVKIERQAGEWVTAGEPLMRLARMDRLYVPNMVEADDYDPHEIAKRPVTVTLTLARGRKVEFTGKIAYVEIEKRMGNKYMVWAEVDNRTEEGSTNHWMLQPGSVVDMRVHLNEAPVQSAAVGSVGGSKK